MRGAVDESGCVFALTHNYAGYPMVREARARVLAGELGAVRIVHAEYASGAPTLPGRPPACTTGSRGCVSSKPASRRIGPVPCGWTADTRRRCVSAARRAPPATAAGIADLVIPVSAYTFGNEADSESCEMHP